MIYKPSEGTSGEILIGWNSNERALQDQVIRNYSISGLFQDVRSGWRWMLFGVYGLDVESEREALWSELSTIRAAWDVPWSVMVGEEILTGEDLITDRSLHILNRNSNVTEHGGLFGKITDCLKSLRCHSVSTEVLNGLFIIAGYSFTTPLDFGIKGAGRRRGMATQGKKDRVGGTSF
ncbi:hypothetical protein QJS10_CPB13g01449 [Acorus calamus]|uniref:Uncharacterized protein n=1 Tax=Acorus calamus TaxID=4465 RepID=A0AAV9DGB9_ACOCL|nr:hypothetical protein QJS10_CPB13g01449 [Acorus calamus]